MEFFDYQKKATEHLQSWKVGALFMEPGTGKTGVACKLVNSVPDLDLIVWVGPLQTIRPKFGFESVSNEIAKWGGFNAETIYVGVESIGASDRIFLNLRNRIANAKNVFIVVDESLKIKNAETKRTKRLLDLSALAEYRLILNGTPLSKNLLDMWSQMEFLSPKILNMNLREFKNTFCYYTKVTRTFNGCKSYTKEFITGYENVDYLYSLIRHYVFECDLSLNLKQNYKEIEYIIDEKSREEYYYIKNKFLDNEYMEWKNNNIFLEMTQKMQHSYCITEDKFLALNELFKSINESETIIFCKYIDSRKECELRYPKSQVLSYQKESFGLNLQKYHNTVYFDKIWDLALRIQSGRRTFRTGQEYDCHYWDLTGDVGLEKLIDKNIHKKIGMTEYFKGKSKNDIRKVL